MRSDRGGQASVCRAVALTSYSGDSGSHDHLPGPAAVPHLFPVRRCRGSASDAMYRLRSNVTTFRELGLRAEIVDALTAQGIDEPFPVQAATIEDALAGRDVCGKAKTGSGKTLAFSATLDREVDVLVRRYMRDPVLHEVVPETQDVDEMLHRFLKVHELDRIKVLAAISEGVSRTLVFVRTKRGADKLVSQLKREGVAAAAIHGDLRQSAREKALRDFQEEEHGLLVATDVAARGIHVDDVDVVVHYDPPEEQKAYVHRSGRTARAGNAGVVVRSVLCDEDL